MKPLKKKKKNKFLPLMNNLDGYIPFLSSAKCVINNTVRRIGNNLSVSACICRLSFRHRILTGCWTPNWCPRVWAGRRGRAPIYLCCWPGGVSRWTPCWAWNPGPLGIPPWHLNTQPAWVSVRTSRAGPKSRNYYIALSA